jgi:hypothetical protein
MIGRSYPGSLLVLYYRFLKLESLAVFLAEQQATPVTVHPCHITAGNSANPNLAEFLHVEMEHRASVPGSSREPVCS